MATTDTGSHPTQEDASALAAQQLIVSEPAGEQPTAGSPRPRQRGVVAEAQLAGGGKPVRKIHWWFEILLGVVGYYLYAEARELHGAAPQGAEGAGNPSRQGPVQFREVASHIDWEKGLQHNLLPYKGFLQVVGGFYGGAHFVVTIGVLVWMLFRRPQFYRFWRTVLFVLTMVAVGIFALYPAEPPRTLKDASGPHDHRRHAVEDRGSVELQPWSYRAHQ